MEEDKKNFENPTSENIQTNAEGPAEKQSRESNGGEAEPVHMGRRRIPRAEKVDENMTSSYRQNRSGYDRQQGDREGGHGYDRGGASRPRYYDRNDNSQYPQRRYNPDHRAARPEQGDYHSDRPSYRGDRPYQPRENRYGRDNYQQRYGYAPRNNYRQHDNFVPRDNNYTPREGNYTPRENNYPPRDNNFTPRDNNYTPRENNYTPRDNNYTQRDNYSPREYNRPNYSRDNNYGQRANYRPNNNGYGREGGYGDRPAGRYPYQREGRPRNSYGRPQQGFHSNYGRRPPRQEQEYQPVVRFKEEVADPTQPLRLNKYMANAGICSRREADQIIADGRITVNGEVATVLGTKVYRTDTICLDGKDVKLEDKVYVLLNKPKDYVTTTDDPESRKTVIDLIKKACPERIYPVGRLDRNTTGVLLLTNDGDMASKLMHPKFLKKKIYHVYLDKEVEEADMQLMRDGIELEDGEIKVDAVEYANDEDRKQVGIEIHSGKNRIVRRIFEHFNYRVFKLDRVYFAGLTKKNLRRGQWRYLTAEEVNMLRMGAFE